MKEMEFKVRAKEKNEIVVEVMNADRTILIPLVEELNKDDMVESAIYHYEHPYLENPTIKIRVKGGKPQSAIKRAAKKLEKVFDDMGKKFEKSIQSAR